MRDVNFCASSFCLTIHVCPWYSELTGKTGESHDKGSMLGDPNLNSAFGIIVKHADPDSA